MTDDLAAEGDHPMSDADLIARASAGEGGAWTWEALVDELSSRLAAALRERDELAEGWEVEVERGDAQRVRAETAEADRVELLALANEQRDLGWEFDEPELALLAEIAAHAAAVEARP